MSIQVVRADYHNKQQGQHIVALLDEYARDPLGGGHALPAYTREHLVTRLAEVPYAFSILCYVDKKPAGLVNCFQGFSTFKCQPLINIHDVVVTEAFRGWGLARRMFDEVEAVARERQCCKLTLEVLEGNQHAQQVYKKLGFESYELDPEFGRALFWEKLL